jgi:hypothetical protein
VRAKITQGSLVVCLFLFLFVVLGGGLHLNPGGAFLAAATGTPLVIHVFNRRWLGRSVEHDPPLTSQSHGSARRFAEAQASHPASLEPETAVRE